MDDNVLAAMARWPEVPHVYGWMSLSEQGRWRLHPNADAWQPGAPCTAPYTPGESINSPQICQFIDRNYASDPQGRWYFQNGPQRVYVRLDAAPYILHTDSAAPTLRTHNNLAVETIKSWWLDDEGRLYVITEHGPGLISGRDTPAVLNALYTHQGEPLSDTLETLFDQFVKNPQGPQESAAGTLSVWLKNTPSPEPNAVPLHFCTASNIARQLGFIPCPQP